MKLNAFLYLLLRDKMTFGEIEKIIKETEYVSNAPCQEKIVYNFSEKFQAEYVQSIVDRLLKS